MGLLAVVAAELLLEQAAAPAIIMKLMAMPLMQCNLPPMATPAILFDGHALNAMYHTPMATPANYIPSAGPGTTKFY